MSTPWFAELHAPHDHLPGPLLKGPCLSEVQPSPRTGFAVAFPFLPTQRTARLCAATAEYCGRGYQTQQNRRCALPPSTKPAQCNPVDQNVAPKHAMRHQQAGVPQTPGDMHKAEANRATTTKHQSTQPKVYVCCRQRLFMRHDVHSHHHSGAPQHDGQEAQAATRTCLRPST